MVSYLPFLASLPLLHIKNKLLVEYLIGSWGSALVLSVLILSEMRCGTCQQRPLVMSVHLAERGSRWPANLNWVVQRRERHAVEWEDEPEVLTFSCWISCRWDGRLFLSGLTVAFLCCSSALDRSHAHDLVFFLLFPTTYLYSSWFQRLPSGRLPPLSSCMWHTQHMSSMLLSQYE